MSVVVVLDHVTKRVPDGRTRRTILSELSLEIAAGELVVVQGPSGSGKSTLLAIAGAMSLPTSGTVTLTGEPVSRLRDAHRAELRRDVVGFVFQELALIGSMSLEENLLLPLIPTGGASSAQKKRIEALLKRFGLSERARDLAASASGGERQRLAIARALVRSPKLLVLDEPTAHLDAENTANVLSVLTELRSEGLAILVSTHDARVAAHPSIDRVVQLRTGSLHGS